MIECLPAANGVAEVVIDVPPVNALAIADWRELTDLILRAGADPTNRVVILRANGRGFCAGVDIKELAAGGPQAMIDVNRACYAAFAAIYDCAVPVIAAVQGFCLGGGVGLAGSSDVIVASDDATFGLPEIERGALGAATHLARLVPQHRMRAMYYTAATATASELERFGSVLRVVEREQLRDTALEVANQIAAKDGAIIRRAKEAINGIDPVDVKRSYRFEQGFTFETSLTPAGDEARQAFLNRRKDAADA